jgi:hypothetical protein
MEKPSIGKDMLKITYKIKPKSMREDKMEQPEEESSPSSMLRQAADMIEEGNVEEAYDIIDEAVAMCKDMHGEDSMEEEYD